MNHSAATTPDAVRAVIGGRLEEALRRTFGIDAKVVLVEPRIESHGDLATQVAMLCARAVRRPPVEIAEAVVREADLPRELVAGCSIDGPGFINITLAGEYLDGYAYRLGTVGLRGLLPRPGEGRRALVEYVSSNPTGPLSVGHCRQAVLGEAVAGLLSSAGWEVEREYYFNDAGRQTLLLGESLAARYYGLTSRSMQIPEGGYQGAYLEEWASALMGSSGPGLSWPSDAGQFVSYARESAMRMIMDDLSRLGVRFDRFFNESSLVPAAAAAAVEALRAVQRDGAGLVYEEPSGSGKLWLRLTALGRPEDRVLVRENGMYTYRTPDIAYHLDKFGRGYDLLVDIFGSDHLDTSRDVTAALSALLGPDEVDRRLRVILHQFVTLVRDGQKVKMSTRAANFVTMQELLDEVGSPDVVRYLFLTRRAEAHMDFDLDLARRQSDENPVYYVQYAFARISGILRTAAEQGLEPSAALGDFAGLLVDPAERRLVRMLELVPGRVSAAADALEPHRLTEILADTATAFHSFYQKIRVVDMGRPAESAARLVLCAACRNIISDLLSILGVAAPERM
jgi:arginyl-tRNA synthetase